MKRFIAILLAAMTLTGLCLSSAFALPIEQMEGVKPYGQLVDVNGKKMNVTILGEKNKETLLLIPGQGEISSYYSFSNLMKILSKKYRIVLVDYFGFGLSDVTDAPRTSENFADEIHTVMQKLGIDKYTIMAHSMGGIYSLTYAAKYPSEVQGFIGIDISTPGMEGGLEIHSAEMSEKEINTVKTPDVDEESQKQFNLIARYTLNNPNQKDEDDRVTSNLKDAETKKFPAGMKALHLLARESDDDINMRREAFEQMYNEMKAQKGTTEEDLKAMPRITRNWTEQHIDLSENPADAQAEILEGSHTMFLTMYKEVAEKIDAFMQSLSR